MTISRHEEWVQIAALDAHDQIRFTPAFQEAMGELGWEAKAFVGYPSERNQGIGLAMVAEASRQLRDRGIRNCFVHWTWLVEWYGRLGYRVWQEYGMARKRMGEM